MHRSGTSALTGALGALGLGLPRPEDRIDDPDSNPEHWEALSVSRYDEELLERLGGSWKAPPDLSAGWDRSAGINGGEPARVMAGAYPSSGALAWKDPRLCLLLPYWRPLLPEPLTAIFVWRSPLAVARSLGQRDGLSLAHGLALWERYNRTAIDALSGIHTYVVAYERLLDNPVQVIGAVSEWLRSLEQFAPHAASWETDSATAVVSGRLSHQRLDGEVSILASEHRQLIEQLCDMEGAHSPFSPPAMAAESAWTTALLSALRDARSRALEVDRLEADLQRSQGQTASARGELAVRQGELASARGTLEAVQDELGEAYRSLDNMRSSTSWRVTMPLRSAVGMARRDRRPD